MSADLINLRHARKARARQDKATLAAENRAKFGRPKVERTAAEANDDLAVRRHAGHKLSTDLSDEPKL